MRNLLMAERIGGSPVRYPFSFVVAGDSGAWPDPTADAIFSQLLAQTARLRPAPVFFAHLGDFAGPGTRERHEHYLRLVEDLPIPNVCVVGNHDLDDPGAPAASEQIHGPTNLQFAYGHTRFIAIDAAPGEVGEIVVDTPAGTAGPDDDALAFLAHSLEAASTHFVVSGGGGTGLCSHFRGICAAGDGRPEDRGALFHAVQIIVAEDGSISGRVLQAFDPVDEHARVEFGD